VANLPDETLMVYADGLLPAEERAHVDAILQRDPESRARLRAFQNTGAPLAALFNGPMLEPPPAHLVDMVLNHGSSDYDSRQRSVRRPRPAPNRFRSWFFASQAGRKVGFVSAGMLAASAVGWILHGAMSPGAPGGRSLVAFDNGNLLAAGALERVLETVPSGQETRIDGAAGDAVTVRVTLTFKSKEQLYCREYVIGAAEQGNHLGLSCRDQVGKWTIQANVPTSLPARPGVHGAPAAGSAEASMDAIVDRIIEGDSLGKKDEIAAIRSKWH
jgi:anti-sigma factor RsiW